MRLLAFFLYLCTIGQVAFAQSQGVDILQTELRMEERLTQLLKMADPDGRVIVKAILNRKTTTLPGLGAQGTDVFMPGRFSRIHIGDISEFKVVVLSSIEKLPDWLKEQLENASKFENVKTTITFSKVMDYNPENPVSHHDSFLSWQELFKKSQGYAFWTILLFSACLVSVILFLTIRISSSIHSGLHSHSQGLRELTENWLNSGGKKSSHTPSPIAGNLQNASLRGDKIASGGNKQGPVQLESLPLPALLALIADCYWCQKDAYAAWIWSQISTEQRTAILTKLPFGEQYARFFYALTPIAENHHLHPAYSNGTSFIEVSNQDLKQMILKHPETWSLLSEMRQQSLQLNLRERLKVEETKKASLKRDLPQMGKSPMRTLPMTLTAVLLSPDDEEYLYQKPDSLSLDQKRSVSTLIWLALLDLESQKSILNQYSAEELATAWVGPASILSKIELALNEKKLKMLKGYTEKIMPSRQSPIAQELSQLALDRLAANHSLQTQTEPSDAA